MSRKKGFTFIELMVVLAVLIVLVLIAIPVFGSITDRADASVDAANLSLLNTATKTYGAMRTDTQGDIFTGITSDEGRMQTLLDAGLLTELLTARQAGARFSWDKDTQLWILLDGASAPQSPFGDTFADITGGLIGVMQDHLNDSGSYGRTWGDYRFTDLGLNPEDWQDAIGHIYFKPSGGQLLITPESGYTIYVQGEDGNPRKLPASYNWNLIYNDADGKWYFHTVAEGNEVDISTLVVEES